MQEPRLPGLRLGFVLPTGYVYDVPTSWFSAVFGESGAVELFLIGLRSFLAQTTDLRNLDISSDIWNHSAWESKQEEVPYTSSRPCFHKLVPPSMHGILLV